MILEPKRNYNDFRLAPENRDVKRSLVENIAEMADTCNLLDVYPIVVNRQGYIMDGQHRFSMAQEMGLSFYHITDDDVSVDDIAKANALTKHYKFEDYLHVFSSLGIPSYVYMKKYLEKYPFIKPNDAKVFLAFDQSRISKQFKDGSFSVTTPTLADQIAERINDFLKVKNNVYRRSFGLAVANLCVNPLYDHDRMMDRLSVVPYKLMAAYNMEESIAILSEIYNFNISAKNRVRLQGIRESQYAWKFQEPLPINGLNETLERDIAQRKTSKIERIDDLSILQPHPASRLVPKYNLEHMIAGIRENNLLHLFPIIIDEHNRVLDGNKRVLAAKHLRHPVYAIRTANLPMVAVALASGRAKSWTLTDYEKHYCALGFDEYIKLKDLRQKSKASVSLVIWVNLTSASISDPTMARSLYKTGRYSCSTPFFAKWFTDKLAKHDAGVKTDSGTSWLKFVITMLGNPDFQIDRYLQGMKRTNAMAMAVSQEDLLFQLNDVYNYGRQNHVHLTMPEPGAWRDVAIQINDDLASHRKAA